MAQHTISPKSGLARGKPYRWPSTTQTLQDPAENKPCKTWHKRNPTDNPAHPNPTDGPPHHKPYRWPRTSQTPEMATHKTNPKGYQRHHISRTIKATLIRSASQARPVIKLGRGGNDEALWRATMHVREKMGPQGDHVGHDGMQQGPCMCGTKWDEWEQPLAAAPGGESSWGSCRPHAQTSSGPKFLF